jgi:hypothetical protein
VQKISEGTTAPPPSASFPAPLDEEAVDADLAAVGVEGDGGEAGKRIQIVFNHLNAYNKLRFREIKNLISLKLRKKLLELWMGRKCPNRNFGRKIHLHHG